MAELRDEIQDLLKRRGEPWTFEVSEAVDELVDAIEEAIDLEEEERELKDDEDQDDD